MIAYIAGSPEVNIKQSVKLTRRICFADIAGVFASLKFKEIQTLLLFFRPFKKKKRSHLAYWLTKNILKYSDSFCSFGVTWRKKVEPVEYYCRIVREGFQPGTHSTRSTRSTHSTHSTLIKAQILMKTIFQISIFGNIHVYMLTNIHFASETSVPSMEISLFYSFSWSCVFWLFM